MSSPILLSSAATAFKSSPQQTTEGEREKGGMKSTREKENVREKERRRKREAWAEKYSGFKL